MALRAKRRVVHAGVLFGPGVVLPADVDGERLIRLGAACDDSACADCSCGRPAEVAPVPKRAARRKAAPAAKK